MAGNTKSQADPAHGARGQTTRVRIGKGGANKASGGAMGQPMGSRNNCRKPRFGAQGQRLASNSRGGGHTPNARRS